MDYDICVIGGGINGAAVARDAALRGLSVLLVEARDLGSATSSASTKLIHGGLRYLEQFDLKLVRESLAERRRLMKIAPHLVTPLRFVLPDTGQRPTWMLSAGLFLYDHLSPRGDLPKSERLDFATDTVGDPLSGAYSHGYAYSDCWGDDARLVSVTVMDAKAHGADILTHTACLGVEPSAYASAWDVRFKNLRTGDEMTIAARHVVNAAGPWARELLGASNLIDDKTPALKLVRGSHIVIPRLYEGEHAYILQQPDGRIVFTIPYEGAFTLVGTTEAEHTDDPAAAEISGEETGYLLDALADGFGRSVSAGEIAYSYSGVRPLIDDRRKSLSKVSRDYRLHLREHGAARLLTVFGGKLTTHRTLAAQVMERLGAPGKCTTHKKLLPGGDFSGGLPGFIAAKQDRYSFLPAPLVARLARDYGSRIDTILGKVMAPRHLGHDFGGGLFQAEVDYLVENEFAAYAEDILWRRTKRGLHAPIQTAADLAAYLTEKGVS